MNKEEIENALNAQMIEINEKLKTASNQNEIENIICAYSNAMAINAEEYNKLNEIKADKYDNLVEKIKERIKTIEVEKEQLNIDADISQINALIYEKEFYIDLLKEVEHE